STPKKSITFSQVTVFKFDRCQSYSSVTSREDGYSHGMMMQHINKESYTVDTFEKEIKKVKTIEKSIAPSNIIHLDDTNVNIYSDSDPLTEIEKKQKPFKNICYSNLNKKDSKKLIDQVLDIQKDRSIRYSCNCMIHCDVSICECSINKSVCKSIGTDGCICLTTTCLFNFDKFITYGRQAFHLEHYQIPSGVRPKHFDFFPFTLLPILLEIDIFSLQKSIKSENDNVDTNGTCKICNKYYNTMKERMLSNRHVQYILNKIYRKTVVKETTPDENVNIYNKFSTSLSEIIRNDFDFVASCIKPITNEEPYSVMYPSFVEKLSTSTICDNLINVSESINHDKKHSIESFIPNISTNIGQSFQSISNEPVINVLVNPNLKRSKSETECSISKIRKFYSIDNLLENINFNSTSVQ
ncbi:hypothetical protein A3Q56_07906, partial [Intoshia linei]